MSKETTCWNWRIFFEPGKLYGLLLSELVWQPLMFIEYVDISPTSLEPAHLVFLGNEGKLVKHSIIPYVSPEQVYKKLS